MADNDSPKDPTAEVASAVPLQNEMTDQEFAEAWKEGALTVEEKPFDFKETFTTETVLDFLAGKTTWAALMGLTMEEAYDVAEYGYALYEEARYHDAKTVFEGLVMANPYDAYFHNMLGAVYQQLDMTDEALQHYNIAIQVDPEATLAYINRGEMLFAAGDYDAAVADFARATELDKDGEDPNTERAKTLLTAAKLVADAFKGIRNTDR